MEKEKDEESRSINGVEEELEEFRPYNTGKISIILEIWKKRDRKYTLIHLF
ncbi:hypothetical protein EZS27_009624 [termite gut metagenome]|uniref:Uncharacterized protein n=1 Tax=termite gut metagenome TaxID=433724 RepID=A0A5J4SAA2_9ZZZZ